MLKAFGKIEWQKIATMYWLIVIILLGVTVASAEGAPLDNVTIWSHFLVDEHAVLGSGAEPFVLADLRAIEEEDASVLRLVWKQDQSDWFATWKLYLESTIGVRSTNRVDTVHHNIALATEAPIRGHRYEIAVSYDKSQQMTSIMVRNTSTGKYIVNEAFILDRSVEKIVLVDDEVHAERIRVEPRYIPVDMYWDVGVPRESRPIRAQTSFTTNEDIAVKVYVPDAPLQGNIVIHIDSQGQRRTVAKHDIIDIDDVIRIDRDALPVGYFDLIVDYVHHGEVLLSETIQLSRGSVTANLAHFQSDNEQGVFTGTYELESDGTLPRDVRFILNATLTQRLWDDATADYTVSARGNMTVIDETIALEDGTSVVEFFGTLPVEQEGELWHIQFQPEFDFPIHVVTSPAERVVAYGPVGCFLDVMSFNIRLPVVADGVNAWPNRRQFVLDVLHDYAPDIVGFQEPVREQIDFLHAHLSGYDGIAVEAHRGHVHNALFYRTDVLERLTWGSFWLSDTPGIVHSATWGNTESRAVVWARFRVRHTGQEFVVMNTHFHHVDPAEEISQRSADLILKKVDELADGLPVIIMGDFNSQPQGLAHGAFMKATPRPFVDAWEEAVVRRGSVNTFHGFTGRTSGNRIDWILVSEGDISVQEVEHVNVRRGDVFPSDHYPVFATLCFAAGN